MKVKKGKVITLTSSKGGIGKTIFITNLAGTYDYLGKKTLLIDLDLYTGGVSTLLDLAKAKTIYNLVDDFINNRFSNINDYVVAYSDNLDILPSTPFIASFLELMIPMVKSSIVPVTETLSNSSSPSTYIFS